MSSVDYQLCGARAKFGDNVLSLNYVVFQGNLIASFPTVRTKKPCF